MLSATIPNLCTTSLVGTLDCWRVRRNYTRRRLGRFSSFCIVTVPFVDSPKSSFAGSHDSQYPPLDFGDTAFFRRQARTEETAQCPIAVSTLQPRRHRVGSLLIAVLREGGGSIGSRAERPPIEFLLFPITAAGCRVPLAFLFWQLPSWQVPSSLALSPPSSVQPSPP